MSAFIKSEDSSDDEQQDVHIPDEEDQSCGNMRLERDHEPFHLAAEECVSLEKSYILSLAASPSWSTIAAGTSDSSVHLYTLDSNALTRLPAGNELEATPSAVVGVRFANADENVLYVGTLDGTIYTYDLRQRTVASSFKDKSDGRSNPLTCIDINANDRVLCAGTTLNAAADAFLLFFDVRKQSTLGAYWECHSEDISQVRFHPKQPDRLASGAMDGLINVFDIGQANEDAALEYCMNTERTVQRLNWHKDEQLDKDLLSCITHMNEVHIYDVDDSQKVFERSRDEWAQTLLFSADDTHVIDVHNTATAGQQLVLAAHWRDREFLRSCHVNQLRVARDAPVTKYSVNKQNVRCSLYNANSNLLVTGGQSGLLSLWAAGNASSQSPVFKSELKEKKKAKKRKQRTVKPY